MSAGPFDRRDSLAGRWHLVGVDTPDGVVPGHRVDLVFREHGAALSGAVLSRVDGREWPLRTLTFDGVELRLKMGPPPGAPIERESALLLMKPVADHFEGGWDMPGTEHFRLKLVRAEV